MPSLILLPCLRMCLTIGKIDKMLSIFTLKSSRKASEYYSYNLKTRYYGDHKSPGTWFGAGHLGKKDGRFVRQKDLKLLLEGFDFQGNKLVRNAGEKHRPGLDLTFSAPKSVSIAWVSADTELRKKIQNAHDKAVDRALKHVETFAGFTRRGTGSYAKEPLKNLIFAKFRHCLSRENDPNIHTHALLMNIGERLDGSWGCLDSTFTYKEKMTTGAIYRAELAHILKNDLGFEIESSDGLFEISGIPEELIVHFSKRRSQILSYLKQKGYDSYQAANLAALTTRGKKSASNLSVLLKKWKSEISSFGFKLERVKKKEASGRDLLPNIDFEAIKEEVLNELTAHNSTFTASKLRQQIAKKMLGVCAADDISKFYFKLINSSQVIPLGRDICGNESYTTQEVFRLEHELYKKAMSYRDRNYLPVSPSSFKKARKIHTKLRDEQWNLVKRITCDKGLVQIALGKAGSGKSYSLKAAKSIWQDNGYKVIGLSPTGKAAEGLERSSGIKSYTIASFLLSDKNKARVDRNTTIVVDEAGMMGSKSCKELVDLAAKRGAKLVLVGDPAQLQPIEAGSAVRMLREGIPASELQMMARQKKLWQAEAARFFSEGNAEKAIQLYAENNLVSIQKDSESAMNELVNAYCEDFTKGFRDRKLILADTNKSVNLLNEKVRDKLKKQGKLKAEGFKFNIKTNDLQLVKKEFCVGDIIYFTRNNKKLNVTNGTSGKIVSIEKAGYGYEIKVMNSDSDVMTFNTRDYKHIVHGYAVTIYKSQGDTVKESFYLMSDNMSREGAYVALSRHQQNARIFVDRTNFSDSIDWEKIKLMSEMKTKMKYIREGTLETVANRLEKANQKLTTKDFTKKNLVQAKRLARVSPQVFDLAKKIDPEKGLTHHNVELVQQILTSPVASASKHLPPNNNPEPYQYAALELLKIGAFDQSSLYHLKSMIQKTKTSNFCRKRLHQAVFINESSFHYQKIMQRLNKERQANLNQAVNELLDITDQSIIEILKKGDIYRTNFLDYVMKRCEDNLETSLEKLNNFNLNEQERSQLISGVFAKKIGQLHEKNKQNIQDSLTRFDKLVNFKALLFSQLNESDRKRIDPQLSIQLKLDSTKSKKYSNAASQRAARELTSIQDLYVEETSKIICRCILDPDQPKTSKKLSNLIKLIDQQGSVQIVKSLIAIEKEFRPPGARTQPTGLKNLERRFSSKERNDTSKAKDLSQLEFRDHSHPKSNGEPEVKNDYRKKNDSYSGLTWNKSKEEDPSKKQSKLRLNNSNVEDKKQDNDTKKEKQNGKKKGRGDNGNGFGY